jgi:hypothetical protein
MQETEQQITIDATGAAPIISLSADDTFVIEGEVVDASEQYYQWEPPTHISVWLVMCFLCVLLPVSSLSFQLLSMHFTPRPTITLLPKQQTVTTSATLPQQDIQERLLPSISISQSGSLRTTGHGHQDASQARGTITFYNGAFQSQTIPAGTEITGTSGVVVITDQTAFIPSANPPSFGETTVLAHSVNYGVNGNIASLTINTTLSASIFVKNTGQFTGGQDARNFSIVAQTDIARLTATIKTSLAQSMAGALKTNVQPQEQLYVFPCMPSVTPDHQPGDEATTVKVTVSETCAGAIYNSQKLQTIAAQLLTNKALAQIGAGYTVIDTSITKVKLNATTGIVALTCQGTGVYQLSQHEQNQLKKLIAGKSKQEALQLILHTSGIQGAFIDGVDDSTPLPRNADFITLTVLHAIA